ncbi:MAG: hypothetical protein K0U40_05480 [Betaproteobacteria bacterium]|nr:hypothetical protein [Betaproteobacteria bacterium]
MPKAHNCQRQQKMSGRRGRPDNPVFQHFYIYYREDSGNSILQARCNYCALSMRKHAGKCRDHLAKSCQYVPGAIRINYQQETKTSTPTTSQLRQIRPTNIDLDSTISSAETSNSVPSTPKQLLSKLPEIS